MGKKKAALLINLGTPDSTSVDDVRRYLSEFLMDKYVIDIPYPLRYFLVNFIIVPKRAANSAEAYRKIWTEKGSPLLTISRELTEEVQKNVSIPVELAMRYQKPSIKSAIEKLISMNVEQLLVIPLFPQYAMSTYKSAAMAVQEVVKRGGYKIEVNFQPPFYNEPDYISALVEVAKPFLSKPSDYIIFSYHGLPERHIRKTDPTHSHCLKVPNCCNTPSPARDYCYRYQCLETTRLVAEQLNLSKDKYTVSFQSRLGVDRWLSPSTVDTLKNLAKNGIKKVFVLCPSFVADCIETLEEIAIRDREVFIESGGKELKLIPCLNTNPLWIQTISRWIKKFSNEG
ncbi:MAG: ferrochelatase [Verrucomicrobiia bacterium]